jgi:hypothetical protein
VHLCSPVARGLRRGFVVVRLLGLRVRIPPTAWMSLCYECCVLSGRGLSVGLITRTEESYRMWCVWVWSWILENKEDHYWLSNKTKEVHYFWWILGETLSLRSVHTAVGQFDVHKCVPCLRTQIVKFPAISIIFFRISFPTADFHKIWMRQCRRRVYKFSVCTVQLGAGSLHTMQMSKFRKFGSLVDTLRPWECVILHSRVYGEIIRRFEGKERLGTVWVLSCHGVQLLQSCYSRQEVCSLRGTSWTLIYSFVCSQAQWENEDCKYRIAQLMSQNSVVISRPEVWNL